jgi:biopolymer transport protein ExbB
MQSGIDPNRRTDGRVGALRAALFGLATAMVLAGSAAAQDSAPSAVAPASQIVSPPATVVAPEAPVAAPSAAATPSVVGAAALPRDLSPWGMFLAADMIVKAVMIGLALASVITWTVWLAKSFELIFAKRRARAGLAALSSASSLADAYQRLGRDSTPVKRMIDAAATELQMSMEALDKDGVKERVASRLERLEAACSRRIGIGTGVLATIGATAPFVGLFGTVWGIMNAFIGISKSQTTNLAVVAPGIAEALLATAFGLVAAIPAVVIYNMFARSITGYRSLLADASAAALRLVSRDLDRGTAPKSVKLSAAE